MHDLLAEFRVRTGELVAASGELVEVESPSEDLPAVRRCAGRVGELGAGLLGTAPELLEVAGRPHLRWRFGTPRVLLLGHFDTVWPIGTAARWPFSVTDGRATGPGVVDMKAGIVVGMAALAALGDLDGTAVLLTSDEELGSPTSRPLIEDEARGLDAVLVLESGLRQGLKIGRKGVARYALAVEGRASHAGLEPERGANALVELCGLLLEATRLADPGSGTTVTPTVAASGTAANVVPAAASAVLDVRALSLEEHQRVRAGLAALAPRSPDVRVALDGGMHRPPLDTASSAALFARAQQVAAELGIGPLEGAVVGGGSDGNLTAAIGTPTLDGLGAVGGRAHAEGEFVLVDLLPERAALVAGLIRDVLG